MPIAERMEFRIDSCIQGYHAYEEIWTVVFGEEFNTEREIGNIVDWYAVAVKKYSSETVGYLPKKISQMCSMFIHFFPFLVSLHETHDGGCPWPITFFTSEFADLMAAEGITLDNVLSGFGRDLTSFLAKY